MNLFSCYNCFNSKLERIEVYILFYEEKELDIKAVTWSLGLLLLYGLKD